MLGKHLLTLPGKDNLQKLNRPQERLQYMEWNEKTGVGHKIQSLKIVR